MIYAVMAGLALVAACLAVLLATQVELLRDMRQVRELTGLLDRPTILDIGDARGRPPLEVGLDGWSMSDRSDNGIILILSDRCVTCRALAAALDGAVPPGVHIVLTNPGGRPSELPTVWNLGSRITEDTENRIVTALRINITPVAVIITDGRIVAAQTVPSTRQLYSLLEQTRTGRYPVYAPL